MQITSAVAPRIVSTRALVERATRAPSSHNTQPWRFREESDRVVALRADRTRVLSINDPEDRELTISCGAALLHLRVAAAAVGLTTSVSILPSIEDRDLLARVSLAEGVVDPVDRTLARAIDTRRTERGRMHERPVPDALLRELESAAVREGAWLHVVRAPRERDAIASLAAEGDRRLFADREWRRELAVWLRSRRAGDGLTFVPAPVLPIARIVIARVDLGAHVARADHHVATSAPTLAVLGTDRDDVPSWIAAGQALARVLLRAALTGAQASFFNQPIQVASLRPELGAAIGRTTFPQLVMRLGFPVRASAPTPRRAVESVLELSA
ncbi:Acg family FMN-binding oxidoreductase [Sandaracinus amylolyticus]|uniref:Dinucleotide-utilizing enzyme n=1 Tax=Sandaracinus amylolyticus TaxID=927083 RepID=A0A0F6W850_9BACT|nr:hypothetical protein [Sandaracinus amylolyticus]AKF09777.1 Dinucleotide-utilizing enzyme [Sandaracinus amylolyticus]